ncbi:MAG TPA: hypothetical protein VN756_13320, partial [Solirubrobacterales bacterium]|nr:hypothetical protein [Solirubrobacterales bacterium]
MTPLEFAQNLARSPLMSDRVLGVAIVTRGLTDDDPKTLRQGWPLNADTVIAASRYVGITPTGS